MIGKIIGAVAGNRLANQTRSFGGSTGAALGFIAPTILRRMSIPAMLVLGAGGYAFKKLSERDETQPVGVSDSGSGDLPKVKPSAV